MIPKTIVHSSRPVLRLYAFVRIIFRNTLTNLNGFIECTISLSTRANKSSEYENERCAGVRCNTDKKKKGKPSKESETCTSETCDFMNSFWSLCFVYIYLHDVLHSHVFDCFLGSGIAAAIAAVAVFTTIVALYLLVLFS